MSVEPDEFPEAPWAHCVECGDPIFRPNRKRCNFCAAAKYGGMDDLIDRAPDWGF